jgi:hypothetical protein
MVIHASMDRHEQRLITFLSRPAAYPHRVGTVQRRETHVSHVFLAGAYAYKLKKPVKFPFLDASTLARRKRFCRLELSLNRRLAGGVYLGMVPITEGSDGLRLGGAGRPIEWVVKMRRLPEARMLDRLVARRRVSRADMGRLAGRLVPFFRRAACGPAVRRYGTPAAVRQLVLGNLQECQPFVGALLSPADRARIEAAYQQFLFLQEPLLAARVRQRRIVDGHGDLRCENICLTDPPTIFDCVEFQPAFRCGDMINDFSFLVMDLEFRGRVDLAQALAAAYGRRIKDPAAEALLPFYKCHRSLVRGKVRGFSWRQHPRTAQGRRVRALARRHFRLARRYAQAFSRPRLVVVGGLIGTGKSTLARGLAGGLGAVWLRTDEIRLREFARFRRPGQGFRGGLYAAHVSELVYQRLIGRAEALLREGRSVVCDGTFSRALGRRALRALARRSGASFHLFECVVPRAVALRRIARRLAGRRDLSEARPEHYDRMRAGYEPVRGFTAAEWTRVSDDRPAAATLRAAAAALRRAWSA